ncbi:MAG: hypothetical protein HY343_02945 [Lentisphaerae bacterium]|nr:hypothetical protein [Lentisphaerota bacterium]
MSTLRDVKHLLTTAAYYPEEMERLLDSPKPSFVQFDPVLGYVLKDYIFRDGNFGTLSAYTYESHGGHRQMVNYADQPCRINTYGNSYTQCAQVSDGETWQEILAAHLREPLRNFGVGGYGVYQAYRRAMRTEVSDLGAEYIVLNIWDDDHFRNIDAARWIRVAWVHKALARGGGKNAYPIHGFPWAHVRYDLERGRFVELPGLCRTTEDLRKLADRRAFTEAFKDDPAVHLFTLTQGGEARVDELERIAEAFRVKVDLRNPKKRVNDAKKLHVAYGLRSTMFVLDILSIWAKKNKRKLMILLSYDTPAVKTYIRTGKRFDRDLLAYLDRKRFTTVDFLEKAATEYKYFKLSVDDYLSRHYIARAGAQVFGHYSPQGCFWFAGALRQPLVDWLNPKPPSYRRDS